ncbi:MAG: hypothetical protein ACK5NG_10705 [Chthoniobacterales bacterium]
MFAVSIILEIARRRQRPGTGSQITATIDFLSQMFQNILSVSCAIVDGQVTKAYMPERMTLDWDIIIFAEDEAKARKEFEKSRAHSFKA